MITALLIIIGLGIIFFINSTIRSKEIKKFPEKTIAENESNIQSRTVPVGWIGLVIILFGVIYINFLHVSDAEKKEKNERIISEKKEKKRVDEIAQAIYTKKHRPVGEKLAELYSDLNKYKDINTSASFWFSSFVDLADEVKGTEFEKRFLKTKDSLDKKISSNARSKEIAARKKYGEDFRNLLLDKGLNIKILVYGKDNKKIKLTYPLFDEVWRRKFETEGYFDKLHAEGFNDIQLSDGYKYGEGVRYEE